MNQGRKDPTEVNSILYLLEKRKHPCGLTENRSESKAVNKS